MGTLTTLSPFKTCQKTFGFTNVLSHWRVFLKKIVPIYLYWYKVSLQNLKDIYFYESNPTSILKWKLLRKRDHICEVYQHITLLCCTVIINLCKPVQMFGLFPFVFFKKK